MDQNNIIHTSIDGLDMDKTCETCVHFNRHYGKDQDRNKTMFDRLENDTVTTITLRVVSGFIPLQSGHCITPRLRNRRAGDAACPHYEDAGQAAQG